MTSPTHRGSTRQYIVRPFFLAIGVSVGLAGCGAGDLIDSITPRIGGSTYAGDIQPTVARVPDATGTASSSSAPGVDTSPINVDQTDVAVAGAPTPVAPTTPQDPGPDVTGPTTPTGVPTAEDAPTAEVATVATPTAVEPPPAEERPQDFPNLADVPETPEDLPSQDELDAEREALATGSPPQSGDQGAPPAQEPEPQAEPEPAPQPAGNAGGQDDGVGAGSGSGGSLLGSLRERLNEQASSGPSTVYFDEGSTDLTDTGGIAAAAERWRDSEAEVRVVGYARILGEGRRAEALGTALQRANAVAAALVEAGVSAGDISVFANALEGGEEERRTRRVDIFLE